MHPDVTTPACCSFCGTPGWNGPPEECRECGLNRPWPPPPVTCPWCGAPASCNWPDYPCLSCGTTRPPWSWPEHDWLAPVVHLHPADYDGFLLEVLHAAAAALGQARTIDAAVALLRRREDRAGTAAAGLLGTLSGQ